jgi:hypothetical protein
MSYHRIRRIRSWINGATPSGNEEFSILNILEINPS